MLHATAASIKLILHEWPVFNVQEPTSGLDARAAAIVMRAVKNIVKTSRSIICTIHQPSQDIFESFDELLLLKVKLLSSLQHILSCYIVYRLGFRAGVFHYKEQKPWPERKE